MGLERGSRRIGRVLCGLFCVEIGLLFLLDVTGLLRIPALWKLWPVFLVAIGACRLLERRFGSAAALSLAGAACLAAEAGGLGLSPAVVWPLLLIAAGVGAVVRAWTERPAAAS